MPSPFPGMDPYLEDPLNWGDFHATFIPFLRHAIKNVLPHGYDARIDAHTNLIEIDPEEYKLIKPDVAVVHSGPAPAIQHQNNANSAVATMEPVTRTLPLVEEVKDLWIEIIHQPDMKLVAVVELLSPWNKSHGEGRGDYLRKRTRIIRQPVHLIEIDLLLRGMRLPMFDSLPSGDYFTLISRSDRRPETDVYSWTLREALPGIRIPLLPGDPDVALHLAPVFAATYELGGYGDRIDYSRPPTTPIPEIHRDWLTELAKSARPG